MTVPDPITLGHTTSGGLYDECGGCHRAGAVLARLLDLADEARRADERYEKLAAAHNGKAGHALLAAERARRELQRSTLALVRREGEQ